MPVESRAEIWLNKALEMENRGYDFYEDAANQAKDSLVADFFKTMAAQELVHIKTIKQIYSRLGDDSCWLAAGDHHNSAASLNKFFLALTHQNTPGAKDDIVKAVETGIKFETEAGKFYQEALTGAGCEAEKKFLTKLVGEENDHRVTLEDLKLYYTDPAAWAERMDHGHLDGV